VFTVNQQTGGFMPNVPYIGVTDFASHEQVLQAVACIPEHINRRLHVGLMMSYKTLNGIPTQTGWEKIWPDEKGLQEIFQPHPKVFNVLHYADYAEPDWTTARHLAQALGRCGPYVQGLQLDMVWPPSSMLHEFKSQFPHIEVILQIGKKALGKMEGLARFLDDRMEAYLGSVDYFLIDWGMGTGQPMQVSSVLDYVRVARKVVPHDMIAVAGGLGPSTAHLLSDVFRLSKSISTDMQGQMRSSGKATDPIEMNRVCTAIQGICSLL
jgi:hypothetical protein